MERLVKIIEEIAELHTELAEKTARVAELEDKLIEANKTINRQACVLDGMKLLFADAKK